MHGTLTGVIVEVVGTLDHCVQYLFLPVLLSGSSFGLLGILFAQFGGGDVLQDAKIGNTLWMQYMKFLVSSIFVFSKAIQF